jgi:hypothetical protein
MAQGYVKSYVAVKAHITRRVRNTFRMVKEGSEPLRQRLARNLKFVLQGQGQSQRAAAIAAKMNDKTFNNLAEARFDPRLAQVEKAAAAVGLEAWQLLVCDFASMPAAPKEMLRLIELFSKASPKTRSAIMQVAALSDPVVE